MDISKESNLSKFRKNLAGLFSGMWGFWIYVGIAFLLLLILYFVFVFSLSNRYASIYKDLEDLTTPFENYALKVKNIYNDKWITSSLMLRAVLKPLCRYDIVTDDASFKQMESVFFVE